MNAQITEKYGRNTKTIYYDVTNFYFEIDEEDELRKRGLCKEKRRDPLCRWVWRWMRTGSAAL
ncbi:MAG: hypothetical protein RQM95_12200 [Syntrophaceticus schinkii]